MNITRRNLFRGAVASGIAAVVGPEAPHRILPPEFFDVAASLTASKDVLTLEDLLKADRLLKEQHVSPRSDGRYHVVLHPVAAEDVSLDCLTINASYRVREAAWSLMRHERRRQDMGKRGHVTAAEVFARVMERPIESVPLPFAVETYAC